MDAVTYWAPVATDPKGRRMKIPPKGRRTMVDEHPIITREVVYEPAQ